MTSEEFNDIVIDCLSSNISNLYVSKDCMADIRDLIKDKSNSAGINVISEGKTICKIYQFEYE